jgi:exosome complex component RRP42
MSITPSTEYIIPKIKADTIISLAKKGARISGRKLDEFREIEITTNYIPNANGSAFVKLGNTQVLVGIKLELGSPYPDTPDEGTMVVSAEFVPTASPLFEPGPPDEDSIELARVIDRSLREVRAIDLSKLVIIPGKKVWTVWIDIYVLDHDGNLVDASSIATLAALMTATMPKASLTDEGEVIIDKTSSTGPLPLKHHVVTVTIGKVGEALIVDPDLDEETVLDSKIMIAVTDDGRIAGIQKAGIGALSKEEVLRAMEIALQKGEEIIDIVRDQVQRCEEAEEETEERVKEETAKEETEESQAEEESEDKA